MMKSVTEFPSFKLVEGIKAHTALMAEGKNPEEIQAILGEQFKLEGDKLKYFVNALDVAGKNPDKLHRVKIMSLAEGETAPPKATQFEELYYVPEFHRGGQAPEPKAASGGRGGPGGRGGRQGGRGGGGGQKESPWGLSPEQKAAKKGGANKPG
ncbi:MAG: hypothetical protein KF802_01660 [Bdellovibrionaceae bacterium]|nr:hypothetical protein [Pseudobdellovibrionaceae bacterium]MBX3034896.1 hypothetical protein [Pseudobdellovibrionaceae bacterium]